MNKFLASYHQERLWFIDHFEKGNLYPDSPIYHNMNACLRIDGFLDTDILLEALNILTNRHETLRTSIIFEDNKVLQEIHNECSAHFLVNELINPPSLPELREWILESSTQAIPLDSKSLLRSFYQEYTDGSSVLLLVLHHAVADRKSMDILLDDLIEIYENLNTNSTIELPELALQYLDFSNWQKELPGETIDSLMLFWKGNLQQLTPLNFYTDFPREEVHIYRVGQLTKSLAKNVLNSTEDEFYTFLLAFKILMNKYSGQNEIVCGVQYENREMEELDGVVGPISNLLVLNDRIDADFSVKQAKERLASNYKIATENAALPFDQMVNLINPKKDMSRTALFDVLFDYQDRTSNSEFEIGAFSAEKIETNLGLGKYDYNLRIIKYQEGFELHFTYNSLYYSEETAKRFVRHFEQILEEISEDTNIIGAINPLNKQEENRIVSLLDNTQADWPWEEDIISLFTKKVKDFPTRIAVKFEETELSYNELDELSNQFAHFLIEKHQVQAQDFVALLLPRSEYQIITILAILKCNAIYIPIDVDYPVDRINYTIEDSCSKLCVNDAVLEEFFNTQSNFSSLKVEREINPNFCAYVIYTSGSTGLPKGVQVSHQNVVRLFKTSNSNFEFSELDAWTMFHSYCFDFSVWEMYGALLFGGKVVLISKEVATNTRDFLGLLSKENITILNSTPSVFYNLLKVKPWELEPNLGLKTIIFGGEKLTTSKLVDWMKHYPNIDLINMYGITETTVHVTFKKIEKADVDSDISNIGVPIPSLSCLILDENQQVVPELVPGELWVGGAGVSLGYLNRTELTSERFLSLSGREGVFYRSGDKVRLLSNGEMEYIGRIDDQVKVRGFRIELGEVSKVLSQFDHTVETIVQIHEVDDEVSLVAYYSSNKEVNERSFRNFAKSKLPSYMVPHYFVSVDEFSVTINGKIDLKKLPDPKSSVQKIKEFEKPVTEIERMIASSWSRILGIDVSSIGLESDFFKLGGDSLKASVFINDVLDILKIRLSLDQVFRSANLSHLSEIITGSESQNLDEIKLVGADEPIFLTSAQTGMWFVSQLSELASASYNMIQPILVKGELDEGLFRKALDMVCIRHESIRTNIVMNEFGLVQVIREPDDRLYFFEEIVHSETKFEDGIAIYDQYLKREKIIAFDLADAPLLRVISVLFSGDKRVIVFNVNHIISDGWSMSLFFNELIENYDQLIKNKKSEVLPAKIQFKEYSQWIEDKLKLNDEKLTSFWKDYLKELPKSALPVPASTSFEGKSQGFTFSFIDEQEIAQYCNINSVTPFMLFWTICAEVIASVFGQKDIIMVSPNTIRPRKEFEKVLGLFLNTVPVRADLSRSSSFNESLSIVSDNISNAREHDYFPFNAIVELVRGQSSYTTGTFSILFAFQNQENLAELEDGIHLENVEFEFLPNESETAKYGLCLSVRVKEAVHIDIEYNIHIVQEQEVRAIFDGIKEILETVTKPQHQ